VITREFCGRNGEVVEVGEVGEGMQLIKSSGSLKTVVK
jgi:hypothetical protein